MKQNESSEKITVLLSAYACEPGKGSEPGVGWAWAMGLAERVDLIVLTRSNNKKAIRSALKGLDANHPAQTVKFIYRDLGGFFIWLKRIGLLSTGKYYLIWQYFVTRKLARSLDDIQVIHHLTFCTPLCSGFWQRSDAKKVIGPVGSPVVNRNYLSLFGRGKFIQMFRNFVFRNLRLLPWVAHSFRSAEAVFPANSEARGLLEPLTNGCRAILLDTGAPVVLPILEEVQKGQGECQFLYVGVLEKRKGVELVIRGFARFLSGVAGPNSAQLSLRIVGDGPEAKKLRTLASELGISDRVLFEGRVPQAQVGRFFLEADVFVFASVRDTSAGVNLEAMAHGLPVLCLAHQGVADITDDQCAVRVIPAPIDDTVNGFAQGMARLAADPDLRRRLGTNGRKRAGAEFSWEGKYERMLEVYREIV